MGSAKLRLTELQAREIAARITATNEEIEIGRLSISRDMAFLLQHGVFRPGSFEEFVAENLPFSVREAYRLANDYAVIEVTQRLFKQSPRTAYAARTLAPLVHDHDALRRVQEYLKTHEQVEIRTATVSQIRTALSKLGLAERRLKPGPKMPD